VWPCDSFVQVLIDGPGWVFTQTTVCVLKCNASQLYIYVHMVYMRVCVYMVYICVYMTPYLFCVNPESFLCGPQTLSV